MAGEDLCQLLKWQAPEEEVLKLVDAASAKTENKRYGGFPLHFAAQHKASEAVVRALLEVYPDAVKLGDNDGDLPLHCAALGEASEAVVEVLLGGYPEAAAEKNNDGKLPIHIAIERKASDVVAALSGTYPEAEKEKEDLFQRLERRAPEEEVLMLVHAASAKAKNGRDGMLPLHWALEHEASDAVFAALLAAHPEAAKEKDNYGALPLHYAARGQASEGVVAALLGTYPEAAKEKSNIVCLPLHLALQFGASDAVVAALLAANPEAAKEKNNDGWLPLHMAAQGQASEAVVAALLEAHPEAAKEKSNDGGLPLHMVARYEASEAVVAALLEAHPEAAKEKNDEGGLPLHMAAQGQASEGVVAALLGAHPEGVEEKINNGWLPLHLAARYEAPEAVIAALLEAYPEAAKEKSNDGELPLHMAAQGQASEAVVVALLGAHPEAAKEKSNDGELPLHMAAQGQASEAVVAALLEAYPEAAKEKSNGGGLPIHCAARSNASDAVVAALLEANPEAAKEKNDEGELPLHLAAQYKASEAVVAALLEAHPEAAKEKINDMWLPLHIAMYEASEAVIAAILTAYPAAARENDYEGKLPLHVAAQGQASKAVVAALLEAHPEAAKEKINDGQQPLHMAAQGQASEAVVAALLEVHPEAAKEKTNRGYLPLHQAAGNEASEAVVAALLGAYPEAAKENSIEGGLPLHCAARSKASEAVVAALLEAHPEAAKEKSNDGELPLHCAVGHDASEAVVAALLGAYPEAAKEKNDDGLLPLHLAARWWQAWDAHRCAVIAAIFAAYPAAARENYEGKLLLWCALENRASEALIMAILTAYPAAARKENDEGKLPLWCAFEIEASEALMMAILAAYPDAAKEKDGDDEWLMLHYAVLDMDNKKSDAFIKALLVAHPDGVKEKDRYGDLPLDSLLKSDMYNESIIHILESDMPISLEDGSLVKHSHSWTKCLASRKEAAIEAVRHVLDAGYSEHIAKLAVVPSEGCVRAINLAVPEQQEELNKHLHFCGRYEIKSGALEHRSKTSTVVRATDRKEKIDYQAIFDEADKDKSGTLTKEELNVAAERVGVSVELIQMKGNSVDFGQYLGICVGQLGEGYHQVVIKFMQNEEQWKREKSMREDHGLDPKYVVGVLEGAPSDKKIHADVEALKGLHAVQEQLPDGIELGKHVIIMHAADRNLLQIYHQEGPDINASRTILQQVLEAVAHMHDKGVEHGDLKFLNVLRFGRDGRLRLTDLDASARILKPWDEGESYTGWKFSSATLPPEMFFEVKTDDHRKQLEEYWQNEGKELRAKVAEKTRKRRGKVTNSYVVKTFRTKEAEPVHDGLPYKLEEASEKSDIWAAGVMAYELLAEQPFVPYDRNNDCASGDGMHMIYNWGTDEAVVKERLEKIEDPVARNFVSKMLQRNPQDRPSVASLLDDDFFKSKGVNAEANAEVLDALKDIREGQKKQGEEQERQGQELKRQGQEQKRQGKLLEDIKDLSQENQAEIRHTCTVLMKGIFEAAQVTMPTTFVILHEKLEEPSAEEEKDLAAFKVDVDGNGVTAENEFVSCKSTEEGLKVNLKGKFKVHQDRFEKGMAWVEDTKEIGSNLSAHKVGDAFEIIKERLSKVMTEKSMYLYLVDELTGEPVRAEGWPVEIKKPSEWVHKMLPLMQLGMHAMSLYNGAAGVARMFGCLLPKVPKELSKGARESIALLRMESSVQEFSVLYGESMQGSEEDKSVRGQSLREFKDFLKKHDPKLKKNDGSEGDFAGLQLLGNPNDGTAIWTTLTNKEEIEKKLNERREQRQEEEREHEKVFREYLIGRPARKEEERRPKAVPLPSQGAMRQPSSSLTSSPANPQPTEHVATGKILIVIEKGRGFKDKRSKIRKLDVPDVYCKIKYGASEWQTHHVKNDEHPVWSCQQVCEYDPNQLIKIDVFDKNRMRDDDYYGRASLDVSNISNANNGSLELEVKKQYSPKGWTNRWSDGMFITIKFQKLLFLA